MIIGAKAAIKPIRGRKIRMDIEKEYASKGTAGTALGLSIAGVAGLLFNGGFNNILGGCGCNGGCGAAQANAVAYSNAIAERDAEIARLRSEKYTDNKLQEFYNYFVAREEKLTEELCATRVRLAVADNDIATLKGLTVTRIPNDKLCPGIPAVSVVHPAAG